MQMELVPPVISEIFFISVFTRKMPFVVQTGFFSSETSETGFSSSGRAQTGFSRDKAVCWLFFVLGAFLASLRL